MAKNLSILEKKIFYKFKDETLLKRAVTHKSFKKLESNENLEFLGDRVLGLVISEKLLIDKPSKQEGSLENLLVCWVYLLKVFLKLLILTPYHREILNFHYFLVF